MTRYDSYALLREAIIHDLDRTDGVGIWSQLSEMVWHWGVFEVSHEARRLQEKSPSNLVGFNGPVCELFDRGFAALQLLAIRRLLDNGKHAISLRKVFDTVQANKRLITRDVYVSFDGTPYDPTPIRERHDRWLVDQVRAGDGFYFGSSPDWALPASISERRHNQFDILCGVSPESRAPTDQLLQPYLSRLEKNLSQNRKIADEVTVHLAHAIDPKSKRWNAPTTSWSQLWQATKSLYQTANRIGVAIFHTSAGGGLPTYQGNLLDDLEHGWCLNENLPLLDQKWDEIDREVASWEHGD